MIFEKHVGPEDAAVDSKRRTQSFVPARVELDALPLICSRRFAIKSDIQEICKKSTSQRILGGTFARS